MPKGLDTYLYKDLDENGIQISGGEAQKIAIARALYKDAPFIILDEPTAACKFCSNGTPILKLAVHSFWFSGTRFLLKAVRVFLYYCDVTVIHHSATIMHDYNTILGVAELRLSKSQL